MLFAQLLLAIPVGALSQVEAPALPQSFVLTNVQILDLDSGERQEQAFVRVLGGRVVKVGLLEGNGHPAGMRVVDGEGGTVIPGLWDMHIHGVARPQIIPLLLSSGITGVRQMGGDPKLVIPLRDSIRRGEIRGPQIFAAGPQLDEREGTESRLQVQNTEDVMAAIDELVDWNVDFIKVHDRMSRSAYMAMMESAKQAGLPVAGHVPRGLSVEEVTNAGQASIEHAVSMAEQGVSREALASEEHFQSNIDAWCAGRGKQISEALLSSNTVFCPTLVASEAITRGTRPDGSQWDDSRLAMFDSELREEWRSLLPTELLPKSFHQDRKVIDRMARAIVGFLHRQGVTLLAGSDAGAPHVYWGSSLVDELELLVAAGLSPLEALRTATTIPVQFLGLAEDQGSIREGFRADFVLLASNPAGEISALRKIRGVCVAGKWLGREELDELLAPHRSSDGSGASDTPTDRK